MSEKFEQTSRTRLRLYAEFGTYEKEAINSIIDDAHICTVSTVIDGRPYSIPTVHWRIDDKLYIHGAVKSKPLQAAIKGSEACISISHFEGYIMTRSAFNHAVVYRSATMFSHGRMITDLEERKTLLGHFVEHIEPGRWDKVRQPTENELKQTGVMEFEIKEISAKVLGQDVGAIVFPGGEMEVPEDEEASAWIGVLPYSLAAGEPIKAQSIVDRVAAAKTSRS